MLGAAPVVHTRCFVLDGDMGMRGRRWSGCKSARRRGGDGWRFESTFWGYFCRRCFLYHLLIIIFVIQRRPDVPLPAQDPAARSFGELTRRTWRNFVSVVRIRTFVHLAGPYSLVLGTGEATSTSVLTISHVFLSPM